MKKLIADDSISFELALTMLASAGIHATVVNHRRKQAQIVDVSPDLQNRLASIGAKIVEDFKHDGDA